MKNCLLLLLCVWLIVSACQKDGLKGNGSKTTGNEKLYPVSFKLSGFTKSTTTTNSLKPEALGDILKNLHYFVFKASPDSITLVPLFKQKSQLSTDADFGSIRDSLAAGRYQLYFVGGQSPSSITQESKFATDLWGDPIFTYTNNQVFETFSKHLDLNVGSATNSDIVLTRLNTQVSIKITDIMPLNATSLKLSFEDFPVGFDLLQNVGDPHGHDDFDFYPTATFTFPIAPAQRGSTGFTASAFVWGHVYPSIKVDVLDASNNILASKVLATFTELAINTQYLFTGNMFDQGDAFNISADVTWNAPVVTPFSTVTYQAATRKRQ